MMTSFATASGCASAHVTAYWPVMNPWATRYSGRAMFLSSSMLSSACSSVMAAYVNVTAGLMMYIFRLPRQSSGSLVYPGSLWAETKTRGDGSCHLSEGQ